MKVLCPLCKNPLEKNNNVCSCINKHAYDLAKEGYLNLLLSSSKNSKNPGDNKEMVNARHNFLNGEYYMPLADKIVDIINKNYNNPVTLFDAGVGTGFYLKQIIKNRKTDEYFGADISKHAVRIAAKENKEAKLFVASVYDVPLESKSVDVITCVFSPYAMEEYFRLLKDDGILIIANPCESHLIELRRALYDNVYEVESDSKLGRFELVSVDEVTYEFELKSKDQISNLLKMTPYVYRAPIDKVKSVEEKEYLKLTADFKVMVLKK